MKINSLKRWRARHTEYLAPSHRKFLIISGVVVAAMGQRRRDLNVQAAKIRRGGYLMGRLRYRKF